MPTRQLVMIGMLLLSALGSATASAWQMSVATAEDGSDSFESPAWNPPPTFEPIAGYEPVGPETDDPTWLAAEFQQSMYDTSLIPRWNRRFPDEGAAEVPPRSWWVPSGFTGQLVWLNRTGADPSVLLTGGVLNPLTLAVDHSTAVTMSDLELPVEAGTRLTALLGRPGAWQPELTYLGVFDQNATVTYNPVASTGVIETAANFFDFVLFNAETNISVSYESDLHNAEGNLWYDDGWRFQMLIGARWIQQGDEFQQFETQNWDNRTFAQVTNDLVGGQLGFRTHLFQRGKLSMVATAKGGLFHNDTRIVAEARNGGAVLGAFEQTGSATAAAGEFNLSAVWQFTPYFNFHFGYTGLWLSEVASVGDQLNDFTFASGGGSFDYGGVSYQGGHLGVSFAW